MFLATANSISAKELVAGESASLVTNSANGQDKSAYVFDYRVYRLKLYLDSHNSPLSAHANKFIQEADKNSIDWRLVPAICGVESTFGKRIPANSYNAYGWANGTYYFESWDESIEIVSKALKEKYVDRGASTIEKIAVRYAPPSKTWARNVKFFMNEIENTPLEFAL